MPDIANIRSIESVGQLLHVLAARSASLASFHGMGKELGVDANTVRGHAKVLEDLFLIRRLKPWYTNLGARFVAMELLRQSDWVEEPVSLYHYRDKEQREVDVIVERYSGEVAGVEVKASATVTGRDFAGLRYLREKLGKRFRGGVVLYLGSDTLPFGERLAAVPLQGLWAGV